MAIDQVLMPKDKWLDFWKYFDDNEAQLNAVELLYDQIKASNPTLLAQNADWVETYRNHGKPEHASGYVTPELMHELTGYPAHSFNADFCADCNKLLEDTGFNQHPEARRMLMANLMHETCDFVFMEEIADGRAYEGRADLGNTQLGDGPRFKGAGVLQLTGRANYQALADATHDQHVMDGVDYVANTYPFTSAAVWIQQNDLLNICLNQGFEACCVRINGGTTGYDDRLAKYRVCQKVMN